jgi:uncharacterized membrane protein YoaT (DUF817 family)
MHPVNIVYVAIHTIIFFVWTSGAIDIIDSNWRNNNNNGNNDLIDVVNIGIFYTLALWHIKYVIQLKYFNHKVTIHTEV